MILLDLKINSKDYLESAEKPTNVDILDKTHCLWYTKTNINQRKQVVLGVVRDVS